ncbi:MAG: hypothetical protein RMK00_05900 [Bacteroidota bacterium]|nr:hypothetical protein [Bacteroidota bacterium]
MNPALVITFLLAAFPSRAGVLQDTTRSNDTLDTGVHITPRGLHVRLDLSTPPQLLRIHSSYAMPSIDGTPTLSPAAGAELEFGTLTFRQLQQDNSVQRLSSSTMTVAALLPRLGFRNTTQVATEGWRFGFRLGSGHRLGGKSGVYFLHSGGWTWSYVRPTSAPSSSDSATIARATADVESFRTSHFGANTSATVGYTIAGTVLIEASYQRILLYKNHVFLPWLGSLLLEGLAQSLIGVALDQAEERNPHATALATLILRSALSWGIYELRRTSGQHFPFRGNTPMLWDEFRIGIGMQF